MGCTNLMPLPISLNTVIIPFKVRKTTGINDGSFAYVDLSLIKYVSGDRNAAIKLHCGNDIHCLESAKTVRNRMMKGKILVEKYASLLLMRISLKGRDCDKESAADDITMLAFEIIKLSKKLR